MSNFWITKTTAHHKGVLRKTLGAKKGQNIPRTKLLKASKGNSVTSKRARLALTLPKSHK